MIKPTVWIHPGVISIYGSNIDATSHTHHAIQVIWPKKDSHCKLNEQNLSGLTIIDSKVEHQLQMSEGWVLLIEPKSELGQAFKKKLNSKPLRTINNCVATATTPSNNLESVTKHLAPLLNELAQTNELLAYNKSTVKDKRIQQLLTELNQCLQGSCIKPANWRAAEVANQLALSESRFLHLFSNELGIAWRPYLLWRRMMCAIQALKHNTSATNAAHLAGFSDSAHLSRTFRNNFGMTIRQALTIFNKVS